MINSWVLAFVVKGVIAASGDAMPLADCRAMAMLMPTTAQAVCINAGSPMCRVYINDNPVTVDASKACRKRAKRMKDLT